MNKKEPEWEEPSRKLERLREVSKQLLRENRHHDALTMLDELIEEAPTDGELYALRGLACSQAKNHEAAVDDYTIAINFCPDAARYFLHRAIELSNLKRFDAALLDFSRAITLTPEDPEIFLYLSEMHEKTGNIELALTQIKLSIYLSKNDARGYLRLGRLLLKTGKVVEGVEALAKILEIDKRNLKVYLFLGDTLLKIGIADKAFEYFDSAIRECGASEIALLGRARALLIMNRFDDAIVDLNAAEKHSQCNPHLYYFRGLAYQNRGLWREAAMDYAMSLEYSNSKEVKETKLWLESHAENDLLSKNSSDDPDFVSRIYLRRGFSCIKNHDYKSAAINLGNAAKTSLDL